MSVPRSERGMGDPAWELPSTQASSFFSEE
jgi:hypothetical protein